MISWPSRKKGNKPKGSLNRNTHWAKENDSCVYKRERAEVKGNGEDHKEM